jgi:hypothetical protein
VALGGLLTPTNVGTHYDAANALKALDLATVEMTGFDTVKITVYVNKIGTGTQNWQFCNVTDTAQVALVADAGATGEKYLATTVTGLALTGQKTLRVRANPTVSTDDPVYFGACAIFCKTT